MRITITLEDDVAASLKRLAQARRLKFGALVNHVLREGIKGMTGPVRTRKTFQTPSAEVLAIFEG